MKLLLTSSDRQIVLYSENIILDEGVYYAWMDSSPHKVTRANTTNTLQIVELPKGVELPSDEFIIGKYVYTESDEFEVWAHYNDEEL